MPRTGLRGGSGLESAASSLSVIVPTYDERESVGPLLQELGRLKTNWDRNFEVIIVDDSSPDNTASIAEELGRQEGLRVRVVKRGHRLGMGSAIAEGIRLARTDLVCVMDADLSHPPGFVSRLVDALDGVDGVIASRYVPGSRILGWPVHRRLISYGASSLARVLFDPPVRDPLSGYFLFRRDRVLDASIVGWGDKPLLEILEQKHPLVREIPYTFRDRMNGHSKLNVGTIQGFLCLLLRLRRMSKIRGLAEETPRDAHRRGSPRGR